jgi:hypothetical protein
MPGVPNDFTLNKNLTYSAISILKETSARFFVVDHNLKIQSNVIKEYSVNDSQNEFVIKIDSNYESYSGESISAEDLKFTIEYYLAKLKNLSGPLIEIIGAKSCSKKKCNLNQGLIVKDQNTLVIKIEKTNKNFLHQLSSPWFVILKKNKPLYQMIGTCTVPYQTGLSSIVSCSKQSVLLNNKKQGLIEITSTKKTNQIIITSNNPGVDREATLTVMSMFANPKSKLSAKQRKNIVNILQKNRSNLANKLALNESKTLAPKWMGVKSAKKTSNIDKPNKCDYTISVLLDSSLPNHDVFKNFISKYLECKVEYLESTSNNFFKKFESVDFGIAWFTPNFLFLHTVYTVFDCSEGALCYFNWNDTSLQHLVLQIKQSINDNNPKLDVASKIENRIVEKGYVLPLADINWWFTSSKKSKPIHPAGLFQIGVYDAL